MYSIYNIIDFILSIYAFAIIGRVLLSWVPHDPLHPAVTFLYQITEPLLAPIRQLIPPRKLNGWDISPLIAVILIELLSRILFRLFLI